jgi:cation transport regulator ChaC
MSEVSDQWYFAYGSNLATDQKEHRTGSIREAKRARLDGYRLAFNKRGSDGTGKANIVPDSGRTVWGVVYRMSPAALAKMDKYEGVAGGHYSRRAVRVRCESGDDRDAVTYVAGHAFLDDSLTPAQNYLQKILQGARGHHLPEDYIREIEEAACQGEGHV